MYKYIKNILISSVVATFLTPNEVLSVEIEASNMHVIVLDAKGEVWTWGNTFGSGASTTCSPKKIPNLKNIIDIETDTTGYTVSHSLFLDKDGNLFVMGGNSNGQLGTGDDSYVNDEPKQINFDKKVSFIGAGGTRSYVTLEDGSLWATGSKYLGDGTENSYNRFTKISTINDIIDFAAYDPTLVVKSDGSVWGWGDNYYNTLSNAIAGTIYVNEEGTTLGGANEETTTIPIKIDNIAVKIKKVESTQRFVATLSEDGKVYVWGDWTPVTANDYSLFENFYKEKPHIPHQIANMDNIIDISVGNSHLLMLKSDGTVWAIGENSAGELGVSPKENEWLDKVNQISGLTNIVAIAGGARNSFAIKDDGTIFGWGYNGADSYECNLGMGDDFEILENYYSTPQKIFTIDMNSEIVSSEIKTYENGFEDGKNYCINNPIQCGIQIFSKDIVDGLSSGWHLKGSSSTVSDLTIFDSAQIVYTFDNNEWYKLELNGKSNSDFSIDSFDGFWIKK